MSRSPRRIADIRSAARGLRPVDRACPPLHANAVDDLARAAVREHRSRIPVECLHRLLQPRRLVNVVVGCPGEELAVRVQLDPPLQHAIPVVAETQARRVRLYGHTRVVAESGNGHVVGGIWGAVVDRHDGEVAVGLGEQGLERVHDELFAPIHRNTDDDPRHDLSALEEGVANLAAMRRGWREAHPRQGGPRRWTYAVG